MDWLRETDVEGGALRDWEGCLSVDEVCCACCDEFTSSGGGGEEATFLLGEVGLLSSSLLPPPSVFRLLTVSKSFFWTALGSSFSLLSRGGRGSRYPMEEEQRLPSLGL